MAIVSSLPEIFSRRLHRSENSENNMVIRFKGK